MPTVSGDLPDVAAVGTGHQAELRLPPAGLIDPEPLDRRRDGRQGRLGVRGERGVAIGQEISWSRADWRTVWPRSATAAPADSRSRQVRRVRAGICGRASVKVARGHSGVWQRQRRLVHVNAVRRPATGRSRGFVDTQDCGRCDRMPQSGIRLSSSSRRTEATATPSSPNSRVVSLVKPVALCCDLLVSTTRRITERHGRLASIKALISTRTSRHSPQHGQPR
jgi:hypothetical protein